MSKAKMIAPVKFVKIAPFIYQSESHEWEIYNRVPLAYELFDCTNRTFQTFSNLREAKAGAS